MEQNKDIETLLTRLPRFQADSAFKETLGERIEHTVTSAGKSQPSLPWFGNYAFAPRLATIIALVFLVIGGGYYIWKTGNMNIFRPTKVMAAEIVKRSKEAFFKPGTIYHHRVKQYIDGAAEPTIYELWADMDTQRFRNHVVYAATSGGAEVWQWFDLDVQWDVDVTAKTGRKDIYRYQNPQERMGKKGERVDLSQQFDELISQGVLEVREGKLDKRDVYVVYDTRANPDKYWDILTFDRQTFQLLRTEKYIGEGDNRKLQTLMEYELQESVPKTDELVKRYFSDPPVSLDGFTVIERVFDTSQGYLDDGRQIFPQSNANWKTYTDSEAGFSLKYPADYFIFQGDPSVELPGFFVATAPPQGGVGPKFLPNLTDVWLGAYASKNTNFQTIDQYLTTQQDSFNTATKIPTTIGGRNSYKVVSTIQSYCAGDSCTTIYVYDGLVLKNNDIYVISMSSLDQKALYTNETMFDQILSTFKFLDSLNNTIGNTDNYDKAIQILQAIPEIQTIQNSVVKAGRKPFFTPDGENGDMVTVSLRESFTEDQHTSRIDTFNIDIKSKVVTVENAVSSKEISLDEWKKTVKERF